MIQGEGDPGLTIAAIWKMLEALGSETKACRRVSPTADQTTCNVDNTNAPAHNLEHPPTANTKHCTKDL